MRVTIPFNFIVSGKEFPAGIYDVKRISDSPQDLIIQDVFDKHDQIMFETESVGGWKIPNRSEIVFRRYGEVYFLSEVLTAGEEGGRELAPSRAERHLRREIASTRVEPETVALAVY